MPTRLECVCCHKIAEVKTFHLKGKARLSWNTAALEFTEKVICRCFSKQVFLKSKIGVFKGLKACNFIKKRLLHRCFPVNIEKLLRIAFFIEHSWWLLLNFLQSLLKITMKKIIPQQSFAQKFLSHYFLVLAAMFLKITPLQVFGSFFLSLNMSEAYLEPNQTSKMEPFAKIVNKSRDIFRMELNI